jgi:DNA-binding response OmpR family regulator
MIASLRCIASNVIMRKITIIAAQSTTRMVLTKLASQLDPSVEVITFNDFCDAFSELRKDKTDLLILECKSSGFDGATLIRRCRAIQGCERVPIAVVAPPEDLDFETLAIELGVVDFLQLPLDYTYFRSRMRHILDIADR